MKRKIKRINCKYTGNKSQDTQTLQDTINKGSEVMVLPEMIIITNNDKKIAAISEFNFGMANPMDIERLVDYWGDVFSNIGYKLGQLSDKELSRTMEGQTYRKFNFGPNNKIKVSQYRNKTFDEWKEDFDNILSEKTKGEQIEILENAMTPDKDDFTYEEYAKLMDKMPRSLEKMGKIDPEKTTSIILKKLLEVQGQKAEVKTSFVDPNDVNKGFITHIKKIK